jgi:hypothetical protein
MSTSKTKLSECWAFKQAFTLVGKPMLGVIVQWSVAKHTQGIGIGNYYDHGADT